MLNFSEIWLVLKAYAKPWESRKARIKKRLDEIWQGRNEVRRDYDWISLYFRYRQPHEANTVDNRTWADLEMEEIFARIDRTTSVIGRQYLYALLRIYDKDDFDFEKQRRAQLAGGDLGEHGGRNGARHGKCEEAEGFSKKSCWPNRRDG